MILKKIVLYVYANSATRLRCITSLDSRCVLDVYPGGANITQETNFEFNNQWGNPAPSARPKVQPTTADQSAAQFGVHRELDSALQIAQRARQDCLHQSLC